MVLYRRKVVALVVPPSVAQLDQGFDQQVWLISETGEVFSNYEKYLNRLEYYKQKQFTCEITGHGNLDFFEAYQSEVNKSKGTDVSFPEALKEPVLRKIHLSTVARIDNLVDLIYENYKTDYYPGEWLVLLLEGHRWDVLVREKTKLAALSFPDGYQRPASARYRVQLPEEYHDENTREMTVDENVLRLAQTTILGTQVDILSRDRGSFTKAILRSFIKNAVRRETWIGAPWVVKDAFATRYRIDTTVPVDLQKETYEKRMQSRSQPLALLIPKYPTEDLDLLPNANRRPLLQIETVLEPPFIYMFLETWAFFNVFLEVLILDSFTLDDFGDALHCSSDCELIDELCCAVLKSLIAGKTNVALSMLPKPTASELENDSTDLRSQRDALRPDFGDWKEKIYKRDFSGGHFVNIIIGLLLELSYDPRNRFCGEVFTKLMHPDMDTALDRANAAGRFRCLSAELKLRVINALVEYSWQTPLVRNYIDECMENLTSIRKERAETVKMRKSHVDMIAVLRSEMRAMFPKIKTVDATRMDTCSTSEEPLECLARTINDQTDDSDIEVADDNTDTASTIQADPAIRRISRSMSTRSSLGSRNGTLVIAMALDKASKDVKSAQISGSKKSTLAKVPGRPKSNAGYEHKIAKIKKLVERADGKILSLDEDFREADAQRLKKVGNDRFWNTYWWMESSGMPAFGMPNTSTAYAGYATGRIWVQGPTQDAISLMTTAGESDHFWQRKACEEGRTGLMSAEAWGYYETPDQLRDLLNWLNPKGVRELKLKSALEARTSIISQSMLARKQYIDGENMPERRSTRTNTGNDTGTARFLAWHNTLAVDEFGTIHSGERRTRGQVKTKRRKKR